MKRKARNSNKGKKTFLNEKLKKTVKEEWINNPPIKNIRKNNA